MRLCVNFQGWTFDVGYIDQKMIEQHAFPAGDDTVNMICGTPAMIQNACLPALVAVGHKKDNILAF